jgi:WD40 repeat protein
MQHEPKTTAIIRVNQCSSVAAKRNWRKDLSAILWVKLSMVVAAVSAAQGQEELRTLKNPDWVANVAFHPRGNNVFAASGDGQVRKWDISSGENTMVLKGHSNAVTSIAYGGRDAGIFRTGSFDGTVRSWTGSYALDPESGKVLIWESKTSAVTHRGAVLAIACDASGRAASGGMDGAIKILEGSQLRTLKGHKSWVNALDFFYIGATNALASGSSDGTVKIWNFTDGKLLRTLDVTNTEIRSLACTPFAKRFEVDEARSSIAVGLRYGDVQVWNVKKWEMQSSFKAHDGDCWAVKFSPDGKTLITGGGDWGKPGEVKLWDVRTGELRATLKHSGEVLCVAVSPDGSRLAAGGGDGNVKVWDTEKLIGIAK